MTRATDARSTSSCVERRLPRTSVHVVTVTHNSASTIEDYLEGLRVTSGSIAGVTVVDNASKDDTCARIRSAIEDFPVGVELIENVNDGFAGGYAAAAASAVALDVPILCLNPDVVLAPGAIDALLDVLNSFPAAAVVTVPLVELDGRPDSASRRKLPTLHGSVIYSVLGRFTPKAIRYNEVERPQQTLTSDRGRKVTQLEATTGALMLVAPDFRNLSTRIFDTDYWMYGEDLQLCADAAARDRLVLMVEVEPSVHVKGVSSGRPRSRRSNRAFHEAMFLYAQKNLVRNSLLLAGLSTGIALHFWFTEARAVPVRVRRHLRIRRDARS